MRHLVVLALTGLLTLSACASAPFSRPALESMVGKSDVELLSAWGEPTSDRQSTETLRLISYREVDVQRSDGLTSRSVRCHAAFTLRNQGADGWIVTNARQVSGQC